MHREDEDHFDNLCEDSKVKNPEDRFKVSVYYCLIDTITSQLRRQFTAMNEVTDNFSILFPPNLATADEDAIWTATEDLPKRYSCDMNEGFPTQLLIFAASLKLVNCATVDSPAAGTFVNGRICCSGPLHSHTLLYFVMVSHITSYSCC